MSGPQNPIWPDQVVGEDFEEAIDGTYSSPAHYTPASPNDNADPFRASDVEALVHWYASYNDGRYFPGGESGTELELYAVLRLKDGRWAGLSAWTDYTGWGCQDGTEITVGTSYRQVVDLGLSQAARIKLGLEDSPS